MFLLTLNAAHVCVNIYYIWIYTSENLYTQVVDFKSTSSGLMQNPLLFHCWGFELSSPMLHRLTRSLSVRWRTHEVHCEVRQIFSSWGWSVPSDHGCSHTNIVGLVMLCEKRGNISDFSQFTVSHHTVCCDFNWNSLFIICVWYAISNISVSCMIKTLNFWAHIYSNDNNFFLLYKCTCSNLIPQPAQFRQRGIPST